MVPFFVQIKCKLGQSYTVANALAEAEIASEIYSTAGHYDLLAKFYAGSDDIGGVRAIKGFAARYIFPNAEHPVRSAEILYQGIRNAVALVHAV